MHAIRCVRDSKPQYVSKICHISYVDSATLAMNVGHEICYILLFVGDKYSSPALVWP